ncbi:uncharacterized protein LOC110720551 [Chenopodium quinoa]|uniref:uncharacterized protein LOC110720551 n=1 Tax=Chenopodium quinoa TaxID=63459 RepID=UPI000B777411|nr:uncharacterized protein LOC110720551 [Chenopodium quinoa]
MANNIYGLWSYVDKGYNVPEYKISLSDAQRKILVEERMKNAKALYLIQYAVKDTIFLRIMRANTAKEAWEIMQQEFHRDSKVRSIKFQSLRRDFENLKMKDNELVKDYFSKIIKIVNQMKSYGEEISNEKIVQKILVSLNDNFYDIVTIIEETKDLSNLTIEQLMGSLESHEQRKNRQSNDEYVMETTLIAAKFSLIQEEIKRNGSMKKAEGKDEEDSPKYKGTENKLFCKICKRTNYDSADCYFKGKAQCWICKKFGHVRKNCRFKKADVEIANFGKDDTEESLF